MDWQGIPSINLDNVELTVFFLLLVCDDHQFKDEMLFYRFRQDDGTATLNPDLVIVYRGCDIYHR